MVDEPDGRKFNPSDVSLAGSYDFIVGGKDNTLADREAVTAFNARWPGVTENAVENQRFMGRAVNYLAERGIPQYLDLGSGKPKPQPGSNVHEIVRRHVPDARVVYVDNDPTARSHAGAVWGSLPNTTYVNKDLRDVDGVLGHPDLARLIDFTEPLGILAMGVIHFVDDDPVALMARYAAPAAPGSGLALSHMCSDGAPPELLRDLKATWRASHPRSAAEIEAIFQQWPLADPGLVDARQWRPTEHKELGPASILVGVAFRP